MQLESPAFTHNHPIPSRYTCEGENVSPELLFKDIPSKTKSLALIMDDPDAPNGTFDHWLVWNLPPETTSLTTAAKVPREGKNHYGKAQYNGPCPPKGAPHRYFFKLYALDVMLTLEPGASKKQLEDSMEGHIIGRAELVGTYQR